MTTSTSSKTLNLEVSRLSCASCVAKIEEAVGKLLGVIQCTVNFANGQATVEFEPEKISEKKILSTFSHIGFPARPLQSHSEHSDEHAHHDHEVRWLWGRTLFAIIFTLPLLVPMFGSLIGQDLYFPAFYQAGFATVVQFGAGWPFYVGSWNSLRAGYANMDVLVALGTSAAYFYSLVFVFIDDTQHLYFETSSILITLILLGKAIEQYSKRKAKGIP